MCIYCINVVKIVFKYKVIYCYTNIVKILCKYCINIVQILYTYCANIVHLLCKYFLNILYIMCTYVTKIIQILCKYCANIAQILFKCVRVQTGLHNDIQDIQKLSVTHLPTHPLTHFVKIQFIELHTQLKKTNK